MLAAGLAGLAGEVVGSARLFEDALREFRGLGLPFEEALAAIVMATVLDRRSPEVLAAAERARDILISLGARPFLEQLEMALEHAPGPPADGAHRLAPATRALSVEAEP